MSAQEVGAWMLKEVGVTVGPPLDRTCWVAGWLEGDPQRGDPHFFLLVQKIHHRKQQK